MENKGRNQSRYFQNNDQRGKSSGRVEIKAEEKCEVLQLWQDGILCQGVLVRKMR